MLSRQIEYTGEEMIKIKLDKKVKRNLLITEIVLIVVSTSLGLGLAVSSISSNNINLDLPKGEVTDNEGWFGTYLDDITLEQYFNPNSILEGISHDINRNGYLHVSDNSSTYQIEIVKFLEEENLQEGSVIMSLLPFTGLGIGDIVEISLGQGVDTSEPFSSSFDAHCIVKIITSSGEVHVYHQGDYVLLQDNVILDGWNDIEILFDETSYKIEINGILASSLTDKYFTRRRVINSINSIGFKTNIVGNNVNVYVRQVIENSMLEECVTC